MGWDLIGATLITLALVWIGFVLVIVFAMPDQTSIRDAIRLAPDVLRLVKRLATDKTMPRSARFAVWFLLAYLISPIDLIPDFIPVIGFADDVIVTALILGFLVRRAGKEKLAEHWPGAPEGLATIQRVLRIA